MVDASRCCIRLTQIRRLEAAVQADLRSKFGLNKLLGPAKWDLFERIAVNKQTAALNKRLP